MSSEQREQTQKLPPVVAALVAWCDEHCFNEAAARLRQCPTFFADIIAAHQPPDGLKELLAAMKAYNAARPSKHNQAGILMWDDGSGQIVLMDMTTFLVDIALTNRLEWYPGSAAAAIRAATEKLRPKPEPALIASTKRTQHGGDCTIYALLSNDTPTDGICTCGFGAQQQRATGHDGEMFSAGRREKMMTAPAPPHVWRMPDATTPVDTLVWCRWGEVGLWLLRHLANAPDRAWSDGATSQTAEGRDYRWNYIVVADPANHHQAPPADWTPEPAVAPEPIHVWRAPDATTPIDAAVWCRDRNWDRWRLRYLAKGPNLVWTEGHASRMCETRRIFWRYVVLADPAHPDRMPPADWTPDVGN